MVCGGPGVYYYSMVIIIVITFLCSFNTSSNSRIQTLENFKQTKNPNIGEPPVETSGLGEGTIPNFGLLYFVICGFLDFVNFSYFGFWDFWNFGCLDYWKSK